MGKGKKAFIDRKSAVTFHLVHRSQHDPLVTDETAPQRVLVEATPVKSELDTAKRREEQKKYGIQFDDDYDYLQHLKKPGHDVVWEYVENPNQAKKNAGDPKLQLPSSVFASEFEEEEGMLNKAAPRPGPRPDLDPDVIAALDDDFDFENEENQMEDDFVVQAMGEEDDDDEDDDEYLHEEDGEDYDSDCLMSSGDEEDELRDRLGPLVREHRFEGEETKSRFTDYSMSSSVIRRNEQLTLLDDRFDKFFATYDEPEMGPLDMEEIEGTWSEKHPYVMDCYQLFKKSKKVEDYNKEWDKERLKKYRSEVAEDDEDDEDLVELEVEDPKEKKWDCESILSTYSNIYNHPKLIDEPRKAKKIEIDPKTGLPANVLRGGDNEKLTAKALAQLDGHVSSNEGPQSLCAKSVLSTLSVLSIRPKDESPEEKKERKRLLKEYRMERRVERKANAEAFKEEKKRQTHIKVNNQTMQGKKIL